MRVLKKKFRKKKKSIKLKKISSPLAKIKKVPIRKVGRWCKYYHGRLPYPMECSTNKKLPKSTVYKGAEEVVLRDCKECPDCKRSVDYTSWKMGLWDVIKEAIHNGDDLTDMDAPVIRRM